MALGNYTCVPRSWSSITWYWSVMLMEKWHWPCVTCLVVYPPMGSRPIRGRLAPNQCSQKAVWYRLPFYLTKQYKTWQYMSGTNWISFCTYTRRYVVSHLVKVGLNGWQLARTWHIKISGDIIHYCLIVFLSFRPYSLLSVSVPAWWGGCPPYKKKYSNMALERYKKNKGDGAALQCTLPYFDHYLLNKLTVEKESKYLEYKNVVFQTKCLNQREMNLHCDIIAFIVR